MDKPKFSLVSCAVILFIGLAPAGASPTTYTVDLPEMVGDYNREPLLSTELTRTTSLGFLQEMFLEIDGLGLRVVGTSSSGPFAIGYENPELGFLIHGSDSGEPLASQQISCQAAFDVQAPFQLLDGRSFGALLQGEPCTLLGRVYAPGYWPDVWPPVEPPAYAELTQVELIVEGTLIPEPCSLILLGLGSAVLLRRRDSSAPGLL